MTTDQAVDPVRALVDQLPRHIFDATQQTAGQIHAALERGYTPQTLAKHVSHRVGQYPRANANNLMHWRLRRAAGHDDDEQEVGTN